MISSKSKSSQIKYINLKEGYDQEGCHLKPPPYKMMEFKKLGNIFTIVCSISLICLVTMLFVLYGNMETEMRGISKESGNDIQRTELLISKLYESVESSQEKITELEKKNSQLKDTLMEVQGRLTKLELAEEGRTAVYELRLTPRKGNFNEVREMCRQMGGDLMQKTLLKNTPGNYREKLRSFGVTPEHKYLYIGITDLEVEGTWKYLNGEDFIEANLISYWNRDSNEPNGGRRENCGTAIQYANPRILYPYFRLNDFRCTGHVLYGVCEIKI